MITSRQVAPGYRTGTTACSQRGRLYGPEDMKEIAVRRLTFSQRPDSTRNGRFVGFYLLPLLQAVYSRMSSRPPDPTSTMAGEDRAPAPSANSRRCMEGCRTLSTCSTLTTRRTLSHSRTILNLPAHRHAATTSLVRPSGAFRLLLERTLPLRIEWYSMVGST